MALINQDSKAPTRKVTSVGIITVLVPVFLLLGELLGIKVDEAEFTNTIAAGVAFVTGLAAFVAAYQTKDNK